MDSNSRQSPVLFDSLSAWSRYLTYAFIFVFALSLVQWCGKFAFEHKFPLDEKGALNQAFYWWLRVPNAFIAMLCGVFVARLLLRAVSLVKPEVRLFRWFHPGLAVRDIFLVSLCYGIAYFGVTLAAAKYLGLRGQVADLPYYLKFGTATAVITGGAILLLDTFKWVSPGAIFPQGKFKYASLLLYGGSGVVAMAFLSDFLTPVFKPQYYPDQLLYCTAALVATVVLLLLTQVLMWLFGQGQEDISFPLRIQLAIVGPSAVGKTLLFTQVYRELCDHPVLGVSIVAREGDSTNMLVQHAGNAEHGILPPPSLVPALLDFELVHFHKLLAYYSWLDMPGEIFVNWRQPGDIWREKREVFLKKLPEMSGLLIAINAHAPDGDRKGGHQSAYFNSIDAYLKGQIKKSSRDVSASIAIVITQWKRQGSNQGDAKREADEIKEHAVNSAKNLGITKFHAKIFHIDSIKNANEANGNKPVGGRALQAWQVTKPILWLAACTCRSRMGSREMARMPFAGGAMSAVKVVGVLEQLEKDAR